MCACVYLNVALIKWPFVQGVTVGGAPADFPVPESRSGKEPLNMDLFFNVFSPPADAAPDNYLYALYGQGPPHDVKGSKNS